MPTALYYHDRFLAHDTGRGHPERPDRLRAIMLTLAHDGFLKQLDRPSFDPADLDLIQRLHTPEYVQRCFRTCREGAPYIDVPDSAVCPDSADIAQLAVGAVIDAVDRVFAGDFINAFCPVRPPGHHAEADRSMGFCLFNNVALAADHLVRDHGLERVAVVDFDVHHGNGTQHLLEHRDDVLFISLHQEPITLFPGTGYANERGKGPGLGYTLNIPLPPGSGDIEYRQAFESQVIPKLDEYRPQFLLISAGFDAAVEDPLAEMEVTTEGFDWMTRQLLAVASRHCDNRVVSVLEGGYQLEALARVVAVHVQALSEV